MEGQEFLKNFALQFDDTEPDNIKLETNFKDIEEWSSLTALAVMAMADEEYNVKLTAADFRSSATVADIFNLIKSRS
jgi:acyl carrier protein